MRQTHEDCCDEYYWQVRHRRRGALTHAPGVQEDSSRSLPMAVAMEPSRSAINELWLFVAAACCCSVLRIRGCTAL